MQASSIQAPFTISKLYTVSDGSKGRIVLPDHNREITIVVECFSISPSIPSVISSSNRSSDLVSFDSNPELYKLAGAVESNYVQQASTTGTVTITAAPEGAFHTYAIDDGVIDLNDRSFLTLFRQSSFIEASLSGVVGCSHILVTITGQSN